MRARRLSLATLTVAALAAVALPSPALAQDTLPAEVRADIDKAVTEVLETTGAPSASIAVVRDGRIAYVRAYGLRELEPPVAATPRDALQHRIDQQAVHGRGHPAAGRGPQAVARRSDRRAGCLT